MRLWPGVTVLRVDNDGAIAGFGMEDFDDIAFIKYCRINIVAKLR